MGAENGPVALVADIGGTNIRFALTGSGGRPGPIRSYACSNFSGPEAAAKAFLAEQAASPRAAAFAVAAPIGGAEVMMTNHPWRFTVEGVRRALGLERLLLVNDFEAIALALPSLESGDVEAIEATGGSVGVSAPALAPVSAMAVLGPGTGLGVSGIIPGPRGWAPIRGEGGHADLAPGTEREAAVVGLLKRRFGHASLERALSGPGLVNLYESVRRLDGVTGSSPTPRPDGVVALARAHASGHAVEAVAMFSALLGAAAGDLALVLGARGGVFIAGGVVPAMGPVFDRDRFRRRFEAKGRFAGYLARIPVSLITAPNPALIGLAALLRDAAPPAPEDDPR